MSRGVYELQGFAIIMDKVALVSRVFDADNDEGYQFNITFSTDLRLPVKFPTRHEADLELMVRICASSQCFDIDFFLVQICDDLLF